MSSIWPTQPADQFGRLHDSFIAASRLLPTSDDEARFAGYPVRLSVAGAELASTLRRAMIATERSGSCDLSVELWDSTAAPGVFVPPVPSGLRTYGLVTADAEGRFIVDSRPNGLLILDRLENRIVGYYAGAASLFLDERARPLHRLLSVWLGDRGVQFIHAGVVSAGDVGALLAGGGGAGKSTTSLLCLLAGLGYLSDDFAAITQDTSGVIAHCLFTSAVVQLHHLQQFPKLTAAAEKPNYEHEDKSVVFVGELMASAIRASAPVRTILLPRVMKRPKTQIVRASSREALLALAPSSVMLLPGGGPRALERLASLVSAVPAFKLELGYDYDRIPGLIEEHASKLEAGQPVH